MKTKVGRGPWSERDLGRRLTADGESNDEAEEREESRAARCAVGVAGDCVSCPTLDAEAVVGEAWAGAALLRPGGLGETAASAGGAGADAGVGAGAGADDTDEEDGDASDDARRLCLAAAMTEAGDLGRDGVGRCRWRVNEGQSGAVVDGIGRGRRVLPGRRGGDGPLLTGRAAAAAAAAVAVAVGAAAQLVRCGALACRGTAPVAQLELLLVVLVLAPLPAG